MYICAFLVDGCMRRHQHLEQYANRSVCRIVKYAHRIADKLRYAHRSADYYHS
jgi:hypothetical protein